MNRYLYIVYQAWMKIIYQKKRYFLYILSFYVGLLLPAFCLANIRSVDRVFYYTTFKEMDHSISVDWFSKGFDFTFPEGMDYTIKAYKQECFPKWDNKYVPVIGIDEKYVYPLPDIIGRRFNKNEIKNGKAVCLIDSQCAEKYSQKTGDYISIDGNKCRIIGILNSTMYSGIILPYKTMKNIYAGEDIQFTGIFLGNSGELEESAEKIVKCIEKNDPKYKLISTAAGKMLHENARITKAQWRAVRGLIAAITLLFFVLNELIVLMEKVEKEKGVAGINLALGSTRKEAQRSLRMETLWITFVAVLLVTVTMKPLARMLDLENVIVVDHIVVAELVIVAFVMGEILVRCSLRSIKRYPIALMLKMKETE